MMNSVAHRGPDGEGLLQWENCFLGHRRLAILDTTSAGHQPMSYKHYDIVFNGEIYNYIELAKELTALGHVFRTKCDTEVLLHSFEEWGWSCLERFVGMWAFVILNRKTRKVFCARDRFGIKPFYYVDNAENFLFASEIKALLAAGTAAKANPDALLTYLAFGNENSGHDSFFQGVQQLAPGCCAWIDLLSGQMDISRYYKLQKAGADESNWDSYECLLRNSVQLRLRSDVPVATCLSGGLDSSTIAAIASDIYHKDSLNTFGAVTAKSQVKKTDESHFAKQVVEHCGLEWHVVEPTYEDFRNNIEMCLYCQDEPVDGMSIFMQYWVMKSASGAGYKVMLDGQGGDESLMGYARYYSTYFGDLLRGFELLPQQGNMLWRQNTQV